MSIESVKLQTYCFSSTGQYIFELIELFDVLLQVGMLVHLLLQLLLNLSAKCSFVFFQILQLVPQLSTTDFQYGPFTDQIIQL